MNLLPKEGKILGVRPEHLEPCAAADALLTLDNRRDRAVGRGHAGLRSCRRDGKRCARRGAAAGGDACLSGKAAGALRAGKRALVRRRQREANRRMKGPLSVLALLALFVAPALAFDLQGHRGAARPGAGKYPAGIPARARAGGNPRWNWTPPSPATASSSFRTTWHSIRTIRAMRRGASRKRRARPSTSLAWAELQAYDVGRLKPGTDYARQFPDQQQLDGTRIPRLADLFDLVGAPGRQPGAFRHRDQDRSGAAGRDARSLQPSRAPVVGEIRRAGMAPRSVVQSFDWRTLQEVQENRARDRHRVPERPAAHGQHRRRRFRQGRAGRPASSTATTARCRRW